ncbi:MAG TPA: hypothetical protein VIK35_02500 [Verrucomicrobiae bacterium]
MDKKQWIYLAVFVVLAAVFVCAFTHWGRRPAMQISHTAVSNPRRIGPRVRAGSANTAVVTFNFDRPYRFTEIKVVRLADWKTNKFALPLWHLISDSNSVPTRKFNYGAAVRGMKPALTKAWPDPLEPNVTCRLFVTAGSVKGWHDFTPPPK